MRTETTFPDSYGGHGMSNSRFRWINDCLSIDQTIVGCVDEGASGDWFAYGCMDDWQDTKIGVFEQRQNALDAVVDWAENHL